MKPVFVSAILIIGTLFANSASAQAISGTLTQDTLLDAASSPWLVTTDVTVPNGITLTIEPGAVLQFNENVGLIIEAGGRLVAVGDPGSRITMTHRQNSSGKWDGIRFENSDSENMIAYTDMLSADRRNEIILVDHSRLVLESVTWDTHDRTIVEVNHPKIIIQDCTFPSVGEVEVIHGYYLANDEYLILIGNTFGKPLGYNDVIDFTDCKRPGPILEAYNNIFLGGSDDGLDLDGTDAHIEGNIFMGFHKGHDGSSTSNAIATGATNGKTSDIVVARNVFFNSDHAVLLKEGCYMIAENNTFVGHDSAAINFSEWPYRNVDAGGGAEFRNCIFWDNRYVFENQFDHKGQKDPTISVNYSLIDTSLHYLGSNNIFTDPLFISPDSDFHLAPNSPAIGAGLWGMDLGAYVPSGISIFGEPNDSTTVTSATLYLVGPGMTHYRYAVNDPNGTWSAERSLQEQPTIELTNLEPGNSYRVYVQAKSSAGHWQDDSDFSVSKSWTVVDQASSVHTSERGVPDHFALYDNFPNPFNGRTFIRFDLPEATHAQIQVFNALGQHMTTLADSPMQAGTHTLSLDADSWSSGVYYIKMIAGEFSAFKRMLLVR